MPRQGLNLLTDMLYFNSFRHKKYQKGFTLIELLVVVAIIGILSSVVLSSLNTARAKARDARRKEDIAQIQAALVMYYNDHGSYPLPYPSGWGGVTTGGCGSGNGTTSGSTAYISGLTPKYIASLPQDPNATASCTGYLYSSDGKNYKLLIHESWEEAYPTSTQPYYDPVRPTWVLMICSGEPACSSW